MERALVVGQLEAYMKEDAGLEQREMLPGSIMSVEWKNWMRSGRKHKPIGQERLAGESPSGG